MTDEVQFCAKCGDPLSLQLVPDDFYPRFDQYTGQRNTWRVCVNPVCTNHWDHNWVKPPLLRRLFGPKKVCTKCGAELDPPVC